MSAPAPALEVCHFHAAKYRLSSHNEKGRPDESESGLFRSCAKENADAAEPMSGIENRIECHHLHAYGYGEHGTLKNLTHN